MSASQSAPRISPLTKDQRFNFFSCLVDAGGWPLGIAFFSTSTIVPLYLHHLHASNLMIGLLPAMLNIGYNIPGLFVASLISRLERVRSWLFSIALLERLPLLLIPFLILAVKDPKFLFIGFFLLYGIHSLMSGINQPAYWAAVGKTIPIQWRGRMFGYAGVVGGLLGFVALPITSYLLGGASGGYPDGFAWCFLIGAMILFISVSPLGMLREPRSEQRDAGGRTAMIPMAREIWRNNLSFRRFITGQGAFAVWAMASPFYLLDGIRRFHITGIQVALYVAVGAIVQAFGALLWGIWSDRRGNKAALMGAAACAAFASAFMIVAPSAASLLLVFAAAQLAAGGTQIASYNIVMEFATDERQISQYTALFNGFVSPVRSSAIVAGGIIADHYSYLPVFLISIGAAVLCIAFTWKIVEPRHINSSQLVEQMPL